MFDDLNNQEKIKNNSQSDQQNKQPVSTEDIFADVDKNDKPKAFQPKAINNSLQSNEADQLVNNGNKNFLYIFVGLLVIVLLLIFGFFIYNFLSKDSPKQLIDEQSLIDMQKDIIDTEIDQNIDVDNTEIIITDIIEKPIDSDQDGLTDEEEKLLGTSISEVDTDKDGLFDREEVKVYLTDPNNPDSDGDGYLDGDEVKGGYNPNGPGKLYEIK